MIYDPELFCVCGTLYNEKPFLDQKCRQLQACLQETLRGGRPASELMVNLRNLFERTVSVTIRCLANMFGYDIAIGTYSTNSLRVLMASQFLGKSPNQPLAVVHNLGLLQWAKWRHCCTHSKVSCLSLSLNDLSSSLPSRAIDSCMSLHICPLQSILTFSE